MLAGHGQGHREADPSALADLVPDGEPPTGLGARDQAGGRGLLLDERGCVRAPFLRRPRRAREPRIALQVDRPREGFLEAELYALPPENYYLPAIEFTDGELAALRTALLCSMASSPTPSRCGSRSSRSRGGGRARSDDDEAPIDMAL